MFILSRRLDVRRAVRLFLIGLAVPLFLAACGAKSVMAPEADVQRAIYHHDAPTSVTLFTMINNRSGEGGHAALLVNGSQRVLFDPSGSWFHRNAPERNDVLFGMTPRMVEIYNDYHARETYHVVMQTIAVPPEVAEQVLRDVQAKGPVPAAFCSNSVSAILKGTPGFEELKGSIFPAKLMRSFATLPGVTTQKVFGTDPDDNKYKLVEAN